MSEEDICGQVLGLYFDYSYTQGERQKALFFSLFAEDRVLGALKQSLKVDVVALDNSYVLKTSFGEIFIEFSQGLNGQFICPVAFFRDVDDQGKKRDLYAVKLNIEPAVWIDSRGKSAHVDPVSGLTSSRAPLELVQAALARKLLLDEERFTKLKA